MSVVDCEQKEFLKKANRLRKEEKSHQHEKVEYLESEIASRGFEPEERLPGGMRLERCEERIMELERQLMEMTKMEIAEEERLALQRRQEVSDQRILDLEMKLLATTRDNVIAREQHPSLHQFSIQLDRSRTRQQDGDTGRVGHFSSIQTAESPQSTEQHGLHPSMEAMTANRAASTSAAGCDAEPINHSAAVPDCVDAPFDFEDDPNSPLRIGEVDPSGDFVRCANISQEDVNIGKCYVAQWRSGGKLSTSYRFPPSVVVPGLTSVTIWSVSALQRLESPPTDFICKKWLTGDDCTTVLCLPNQQAISWNNPPRKAVSADRRFTYVPRTGDSVEYRPATADGMTGQEPKDDDGCEMRAGKEARDEAVSKSPSRNQKLKQDAAAKNDEMLEMGVSSGTLTDCDHYCEEEEVEEVEKEEDNGCDDSSSDEDDDDDECGAQDDDELIDCWWGERRCNIAKTIPSASIHLDVATMKKDQGSHEDSACRDREFYVCSSSSSLAAKAAPVMKNDGGCSGTLADCEFDCEEEEEEDNGCEVSSSDDCECGDDDDDDECGAEDDEELVDCWWGERRCSLSKTIPCASVHLDDINSAATKKKNGQGSNEDSACRGREFNECPSNISTGGGSKEALEKGHGWLRSWFGWFGQDPCCDDKKVAKGCCDDKKVTKGCCDDKKVTKGCCDIKKVTKGCCDDKKVTKGCCDNKKVTKGCCDDKKVTKGCCDDKKVTKGCCGEKQVTRGYCDEKNFFARGCCKDEVTMEGGCCAEDEKKAVKKMMRRCRTCEEEEDCVDPCQRIGRRFDSDFGSVRGGKGRSTKESSVDARVDVARPTASHSRRCL